jgi:hypothetical protein
MEMAESNERLHAVLLSPTPDHDAAIVTDIFNLLVQ